MQAEGVCDVRQRAEREQDVRPGGAAHCISEEIGRGEPRHLPGRGRQRRSETSGCVAPLDGEAVESRKRILPPAGDGHVGTPERPEDPGRPDGAAGTAREPRARHRDCTKLDVAATGEKDES